MNNKMLFCRENCEACEEQGLMKPALYWCMTCPDLICDECNALHKTLRSTRNHVILEIDDYRQIGKYLSMFDPCCKTHPTEVLNYFCFTHDIPCCCICKDKEHTNGCHVQHGDGISVDQERGQMLQKTVDKVGNLLIQVEKALVENENDTSCLHLQRQRFEAELAKGKEEINKFLDDFELNVKDKFNAAFEKRISSLTHERKVSNEEQRKYKNKQEIVGKIMRLKLTKLQSFQIGRMFYDGLKPESQATPNHARDGKLNLLPIFNVNFEKRTIQFSDGFQITTALNEGFPEYNEENGSSTLKEENIDDAKENETIKNGDDTKAKPDVDQIDSPANRSKYRLRHSFYFESGDVEIQITSIRFMEPDFIVMSEQSKNRLLLYNINGMRRRAVDFDDKPGELAIVQENNEIIVSVLKRLHFLNATTTLTRQTTILKDYVQGLASANSFVYVCLHRRGLLKLDLSGNVLRRIPFIKGKLYICVTNEEEVFSIRKGGSNDELHCYNFSNNKKDVFSLDCPSAFSGIANDKSGNVYLGTRDSDVIMFDRRTSSFEAVLTDDDDIDDIRGVASNKDGTIVAVSSNNGNVITVFEA